MSRPDFLDAPSARVSTADSDELVERFDDENCALSAGEDVALIFEHRFDDTGLVLTGTRAQLEALLERALKALRRR